MELLLNLVWMIVAVGLLGTWRTRWVHERGRSRRHSLREWTALSIALILLFFAVSMTDDLHSEIVALEECSTTKRDLVCSQSAQALPHSGTPAHASTWAILPSVSFFGSSSPLQKLERAAQVRISALSSNSTSGRDPPVSSL